MSKPFPGNRDVELAHQLVRDWVITELAPAIGGRMVTFGRADPCVHQVMSADHKEHWFEAIFGWVIRAPYFKPDFMPEHNDIGYEVEIIEPVSIGDIQITFWGWMAVKDDDAD